MRKELSEKDNFIVTCESIITSFDRKVITRLYQPITGSIASSLYLTFLSLIEFDNTVSKTKSEISSLLKIMNVPISDFLCAASKLEGIGLIKTRFNTKDGYYVFSLYSPLTPKEYFDNMLYSTLLSNQLGEEEFAKTKIYFSHIILNGDNLEDVSDKFDDIYSVDVTTKVKNSANLVSKKTIDIKSKFNYSVFYKKLEELHIDKSVCKEIEDELPIISLSSGKSAVDLASLIHKCLNKDGKVDISKLKSLSHKDNISINERNSSSTGNEQLDLKIKLYNSKDPYEFLLIKNNFVPIALADRKIIDSLINVYNLNYSVCNVLIDYVLEVNNNKLSRAYIEKVASSLVRSNIVDPYEAMKYLNNSSSKKKIEVIEEKNDNEKKYTEDDIQEALKKLNEMKAERD